MPYRDYCIEGNITVRDAMKAIDKVSSQIVFLIENGCLAASLTDGDIRRFLLNGGKLTDSAIEAGNRNPRAAKNEQEAARLYHRKNFVAIPIVNSGNQITGIYFGEGTAVKKTTKLNIPIVINAGGKGTRLEPYTKILPKPLIPVGEEPIIEHIMHRFQDYGCNQFHIIVNYKKELIKAYFSDCDRQYDIVWYNEEKPLGTGGGLCYLRGKLDTTFFFTNCDNLLLSNYESILKFHRENQNVITMICAYKNFTIPYGVVEMGLNGTIEEMREKPELSYLTNTGIYLVEPEVLEDLETDTSIGFPDIMKKQMAMGKKVAVYPVGENEWLDMGQLDELEKMRKKLCGDS